MMLIELNSELTIKSEIKQKKNNRKIKQTHINK